MLSESREIDRRVMPLADAMAAVVGRGVGTVLSCFPGGSPTTRTEEGDRYVFTVAAG